MKYVSRLLFVLAVTWTSLVFAQEKLAYIDLVNQLTDLSYVATLPLPGETCSQWSSYDRKSTYDEKTGQYTGWDANGDGSGCIREENGQIVMAEMQGPGCIRRIWSARPEAGHVKIYLDGAKEPAVDLPFSGYFDGKNAPFNRSSLCYEASKGWNCFVPIPYRKSCKIVADKKWGSYFHFTYTTFPKGTAVPTFRRNLAARENAALDEANKRLAESGQAPAARNAQVETKETVLQPMSSAVVSVLEGPAAIVALRVKVDGLPATPDDRAVLRQLVLKIAWDGEGQPSVWSPLGDFFGTAPGANPYKTYVSGLTADGWWYSYWYMPYARRAAIELQNDSNAERKVTFEITRAPLVKPIERLMRFHAKWHVDTFLPTEPERAIDWTLLKTAGVGRFCGVMLHVWNPRGGWWGEGDEKFFVDGEKFPSTFGTGSEDYFGYAWCNPALFQRAFHAQTISEENAGHICVSRWQLADNIPFQKSFEGCIEKYFPKKRPTLYDSTVYWYLRAGGSDAYKPVPTTDRMIWPQPDIKHVEGAIEAESMKVLKKTAGKTHKQDMMERSGSWSGDAQLWWTDAQSMDRLELALEVKTAGRYRLVAQFTKAPDYGIVQCHVDGKKAGSPVDLYADSVIAAPEPAVLGEFTLDTRPHAIAIEIVGANAKAAKKYMVGIDYFKLEPAGK